jgi:hypothetical protein
MKRTKVNSAALKFAGYQVPKHRSMFRNLTVRCTIRIINVHNLYLLDYQKLSDEKLGSIISKIEIQAQKFISG